MRRATNQCCQATVLDLEIHVQSVKFLALHVFKDILRHLEVYQAFLVGLGPVNFTGRLDACRVMWRIGILVRADQLHVLELLQTIILSELIQIGVAYI